MEYFKNDLEKHISETTRTIRYGNLIIKILNPHSNSPGFMVKNMDNPTVHWHLYVKDGKAKFHYTDENIESKSEKHKPIDIQKFQGEMAKWFYDAFKNVEKLEITDPRYTGKKFKFISKVDLEVKDVKKKEITIGDNYKETLKNFERINEIQEDAFGVLLDEDGKETEILFLKSGDIYKLDLSSFDTQKT